MSGASRFVVGIDLGTTHSALAYAPIPADDALAPPQPKGLFVARDAGGDRQ